MYIYITRKCQTQIAEGRISDSQLTSVLIFIFLVRVKFKGLLVDHLLQNFFCWLKVIPGPIKRLLTLWLGLFIVQPLKIGMLQALLNCVALLRVENKHLAQQVQSNWVSFGIERAPALFVAFGQFSDIFASKIISNESHILTRGCTEHCYSPLDLVEIIITREKRSAAE